MANFNYNRVILGGRLCADPELKQTPSGISVVSVSVAVRRSYAEEGKEAESDFFTVVAWRKTAEFLARYFRRGSSVCVTGQLRVRVWQDTQGQKRYATEVVADEVTFVDSRGEGTSAGTAPASSHASPGYAKPSAPDFAGVQAEDDLPF